MINKMSPGSGRMLKENGEYVNIADLFPGVVSGKVVGTGTAEFAAEATANTLKEVTITPEGNIKSALRLEVDNPSTETDLTVEIYDGDYFVDWFTIPKKATRANGKEVQKHIRMLAGVGAETITIAVSNDAAITTAFDVTVTIREV
jgi:lysine/ornithine N-monooxygenase